MLQWIAGTFESEGTVAIIKKGEYSRSLGCLLCSVASTDQQMLIPFVERWPMNLYYKTPKAANSRPYWVWSLQAKNAARFLVDIQPYIFTDRVRAKIALALEYQETKDRKGLSRRHISEEYRALQADYHRRMQVLNRRGRQAS